jgi:hypothetical protein
LKTGPTDCPETSVTKYQYTLCNNPEEQRSQTAAQARNHAKNLCDKTKLLPRSIRVCRFLKAGFKNRFFYKCVKFETRFLKYKKPVLGSRIKM